MTSKPTLWDDAHFLVRCLRYRLRTERLQIKTMMRLRLQGATVLDIGANKGINCFWLARAVGPSGHVVAFEPQPEMRDGIEHLKRRFDWSNLEVINVALSDTTGTMNLSRQKVGDGSATLEVACRHDGDATLDVQVKRLDEIAVERFSKLRFIKCDVEGHELAAFSGGAETIRNYRPVVQFESTVTDEKTPVIFQFYRQMGTPACFCWETNTSTIRISTRLRTISSE